VYWSDLPFRPSEQKLRRFGVAGLVIFTMLAGWQYVQERPVLASCLLALAIVFGALALAHPAALRPVFVGLMVVGFPVNWLLSHVMLGVIFYCLFTPIAILFKLIGRDVLARRGPSPHETYWADKPRAEGVRSYFRQS
jgi:uncharacterized protein YjeT (DUF2065 family)